MNDTHSAHPFPTFRRITGLVFSRWTAFALFSLITCIALLYAEENWRGKRAWEASRREVESRGETLDFAALVPPEIPDGENFAAAPIVHLWFARDERRVTNRWPNLVSQVSSRLGHGKRHAQNERMFTDLVAWRDAFAAVRSHDKTAGKIIVRERTPDEQAEGGRAVLKELEVYEPVLNEFRANMDRPRARYPIDYRKEDPFAILLPHLARIKSTAMEISLRVSAELAVGETNAAFNDMLLLVRVCDSLRDETLLISGLVRLSCVNIAAQPLWEGLARRQWTDAQLQTLQERFGAMNFGAHGLQASYMERAAGVTTIDYVRRNRRMAQYLSDDPNAGHNAAFSVVRLVPRGWFHMEQAEYVGLFNGELPPLQKTPFDPLGAKDASARAESILAQERGLTRVLNHHVFAALLLPALGKASLKFGSGEILCEQAATACALERYRLAKGEFPETLEPLVPQYLKAAPFDVFSKKPMAYRRTDGGAYILYSVGADAKDDGGRPGKTAFDYEAGDWVWKSL